MTPLAFPSVQFTIRNELTSYVEMKNLLPMTEACFNKAAEQQYKTPKFREKGEFAKTVWMYACLVDSALSGRKYYEDGADYTKEWESAVRFMKNELKKKKFLIGKPVYNIPKLCADAARALQCLDSDSCGRELIDWIQQSGASLTDFFESVHKLEERLNKVADSVQTGSAEQTGLL